MFQVIRFRTPIGANDMIYLSLGSSLDLGVGHNTADERLEEYRRGIGPALKNPSAEVPD